MWLVNLSMTHVAAAAVTVAGACGCSRGLRMLQIHQLQGALVLHASRGRSIDCAEDVDLLSTGLDIRVLGRVRSARGEGGRSIFRRRVTRRASGPRVMVIPRLLLAFSSTLLRLLPDASLRPPRRILDASPTPHRLVLDCSSTPPRLLFDSYASLLLRFHFDPSSIHLRLCCDWSPTPLRLLSRR